MSFVWEHMKKTIVRKKKTKQDPSIVFEAACASDDPFLQDSFSNRLDHYDVAR